MSKAIGSWVYLLTGVSFANVMDVGVVLITFFGISVVGVTVAATLKRSPIRYV